MTHYPSGSVFEGECSDGKPFKGKIYRSTDGECCNDGHGVSRDIEDGSVIDGQYEDDKNHGDVIYTQSDGTTAKEG